MGSDFMVVCVDRIWAAECFGPVNGGGDCDCENNENGEIGVSLMKKSAEKIVGSSSSKSEVKSGYMVECRICQEEDEVCSMEAPCACNGTLKFAHRKCIQRWCNKKGDVTCEICNKVYSPNYSLPPARTNPDVMAIDVSQAWGPRIDIRGSRHLALVAAEHQVLQSEYDEDDYPVANTDSIACLRSVALTLLVILLIHQTLMVTRHSGKLQDASSFFNVTLLQIVGFLLPCYVMARSLYIIQAWRRRQG